eukprot:jgi/Chlat1/8222/Chrsp76S00616
MAVSKHQLAALLEALSVETRELGGGVVERVEGPLSAAEFLREYVALNRPCIVTGAIEHWPALTKWSKMHLREVIGTTPVTVDITPTGYGDAIVRAPSKDDATSSNHSNGSTTEYFVTPHEENMAFGTFLDLLHRSRADSSSGVPYVQHQNGSFTQEFAQLREDVDDSIEWAQAALGCEPDAVNMWVGDERAVTSFHKDHYENLYAVVAGEKHFTLLPPTEVHRMYIKDFPAACYRRQQDGFTVEPETPTRIVPWAQVDPCATITQELKLRYPRYYDGPAALQCTVKKGEVLYLPAMWYHHVRQTTGEDGLCIAVNYWYDMRYDAKFAYFNLVSSLSALLGDESNNGDETKACCKGGAMV